MCAVSMIRSRSNAYVAPVMLSGRAHRSGPSFNGSYERRGSYLGDLVSPLLLSNFCDSVVIKHVGGTRQGAFTERSSKFANEVVNSVWTVVRSGVTIDG